MPMSQEVKALVLSSAMILLAYLMISRWKFPSSKMLHIHLHTFQLLFLTALVAIFIIYGLLYFFAPLLTGLSWGYLFLGWGLSIARLIAGKKSHTLEDFEPEEDED